MFARTLRIAALTLAMTLAQTHPPCHAQTVAPAASAQPAAADQRADPQQEPAARGNFTAASPLPGVTVAHAAVRLLDGKVLVTGGFGQLFGLVPLAVTMNRLFDPDTGQWRVLPHSLKTGRLEHAMLLLPDGNVLIAGGRGQDNKPVATLELFHSGFQTCRTIARMNTARIAPRLNLLPDNSVLITGAGRSAEIFQPDPRSDTGYSVRTLDARCHARHDHHAAVSLADGRVLLVGGASDKLEIFDPASQSFSLCKPRLPHVLDDQAAILLYDATVLIAGGQRVYGNLTINNTWLYHPAKDTLAPGPPLTPSANNTHQPGAADVACVDLFPDDPRRARRYILLCGGEYDPGTPANGDVILDSASIYDAPNRRLIDVGPMIHPHDEFAAVSLTQPNGPPRALIIGGYDAHDAFQPHCELFTLQTPLHPPTAADRPANQPSSKAQP